MRRLRMRLYHAELLALVDSLRAGTLNEQQVETVHTLRAGILTLAQQATGKAKMGAP